MGTIMPIIRSVPRQGALDASSPVIGQSVNSWVHADPAKNKWPPKVPTGLRSSRMSIRRLILPAMALALLAAPPADAASPTETLKSFFASANTILQSADPMRGLEAPRRSIRELVDQVFDYQEAAELVLGPVWQTGTPAERTEFVQLFADFLERGFVAMIGSKASVAAGVTVQYLGEFIDGESATVATSVLTRNGGDLPVEYSMLRWGDRWM